MLSKSGRFFVDHLVTIIHGRLHVLQGFELYVCGCVVSCHYRLSIANCFFVLQVYTEVIFGSSEEYQSLEELRDLLRQQKTERDTIIAQKIKGQTLDKVRAHLAKLFVDYVLVNALSSSICSGCTFYSLRRVFKLTLIQAEKLHRKEVNKKVNDLHGRMGRVCWLIAHVLYISLTELCAALLLVLTL